VNVRTLFLISGAQTPFDCTYAWLHSKGQLPVKGGGGRREEEGERKREEGRGEREGVREG
jgi:hypothetical protein